MANVTWLARLFLNYQEPITAFTRILDSEAEIVWLYSVQEASETVSYGEPLDVQAIVSPLSAEEVVLEPGYFLTDYEVFYTFLPVRQHDKIRRRGDEYELQSVQCFTFQNEPLYFKSVGRRLITS